MKSVDLHMKCRSSCELCRSSFEVGRSSCEVCRSSCVVIGSVEPFEVLQILVKFTIVQTYKKNQFSCSEGVKYSHTDMTELTDGFKNF